MGVDTINEPLFNKSYEVFIPACLQLPAPDQPFKPFNKTCSHESLNRSVMKSHPIILICCYCKSLAEQPHNPPLLNQQGPDTSVYPWTWLPHYSDSPALGLRPRPSTASPKRIGLYISLHNFIKGHSLQHCRCCYKLPVGSHSRWRDPSVKGEGSKGILSIWE